MPERQSPHSDNDLIAEMTDGTVVTGVAVPPALPAMVLPLPVPVGWVGSVTT